MDLRYCSSFNDKKERGIMELKDAQTFFTVVSLMIPLQLAKAGVSAHCTVYACYTERRQTPREVRKVLL
jgi:hypothetical protein